jgi:hypothetical protein
VVAKHDLLAKKIGLNIDQARNLPDIILADVGSTEVLLVFVEVVTTDGPIHEDRKVELYKLTRAANFDDAHVAFVTAYVDRSSKGYARTYRAVAWNTFIWFASEPENIIALHGSAGTMRLRALMTP